jgi:hypothetical protein
MSFIINPYRFAVGFTPADITSIVSWYRADLGVTTATGVSNWADQVGSNDLSQATGAAQPTFNASDADFNSNPSMTFDGSDDILGNAAFTGSDGFFVFLAFTQETWNSNDIIIGFRDSGNDLELFQSLGGSSPQVSFRMDGTYLPLVSPTLSTPFILTGFKATGDQFITLNDGAEVTSTTANTVAPNALSLGGALHKGAQKANIKVAEFGYCSAEPTTDEKASLKAYLNARYAIY